MTPPKIARIHVLVLAATLFPLCSNADDLPDPIRDASFNSLATAPETGEASGKWGGNFGAGVTMRRGSSANTQGSLSLDALRVMRDSRLLANALMVRSASRGEDHEDNANASLRGERNIDAKWFGFAEQGFERDTAQALDARYTTSLGLGWRFLHGEETDLNLYSGLAYSQEHNREGGNARGVEALLGLEARHQFSEGASFSLRAVAVPNAVGPRGARVALQGALNTRITSRLGLQIAALHKYRENPPDDAQQNELVLFTGVTARF
ncbi:MAG: hypothetical protein CGU28_14090 [Candidatus Dactylopiibacterium carminicum]|uniref:DUF481 domain-containing protein n=1 Tax=Candidatus Dactylopiibacterium carminicum TaxID=857335 RepID=A0A272ET92_9RHOO|nr:DUF481 domain-containing protein [Candidatus Dactylopiibacterium carminicum]KAF7599331.1 DUF481 domain-containing protein [Candidatus Dactylopiibacterium carminicum]PAS93321.1 MAG: hypothetical protein CGU29_08285 [Candidatus Dactylopiibacterium carminicum]PAS94344.1 MAG: hypothetical protein CGU28_14090 [Candidatus Dactylopiibacterium carminicum]PAS99334.1 MAG: hypothetical protein BSR46_08670 [Candidatus Dactylopiibacterium carminicum]